MKIATFFQHAISISNEEKISLFDALVKVKETGVCAVEICGKENGDDETLRLIFEAGLLVTSVYDFYSANESTWESTLERQFEACKSANAQFLMIVPLVSNNPSEKDLRKIIAMALEKTQGTGIRVTIEDFDDTKTPLQYAPFLVELLSEFASLSFNLDTGNFALSDGELQEIFEQFYSRTVNVHLKDRVKLGQKQCAFIGSGEVPIATAVKQLLKRGYDGYFSIEQFGVKGHLRGIEEGIKFIKSCL